MATCRQTWLKSMQLLDDLCAFDEGDLTTNLRPPPPAKPDAELIEDTLPMPEFFNWCSLAATPDDDGKRSPRPSFFDTNFLLLGQDVRLPPNRLQHEDASRELAHYMEEISRRPVSFCKLVEKKWRAMGWNQNNGTQPPSHSFGRVPMRLQK
ncbi:unnamed protein product [Durusdinium trenchii]|uniref:Uncharacterized protein n=2 Tax=Durusdinium trenchii TaxID=1381693 RepID=A0ABP0R0N4_9DINO